MFAGFTLSASDGAKEDRWRRELGAPDFSRKSREKKWFHASLCERERKKTSSSFSLFMFSGIIFFSFFTQHESVEGSRIRFEFYIKQQSSDIFASAAAGRRR